MKCPIVSVSGEREDNHRKNLQCTDSDGFGYGEAQKGVQRVE